MHPRAKAHYVAELIEGNRRSAKPYACRKCGVACLQGDDHDTCAARATVETDPVSIIDEMFYVLEGRATYDLVPRGGNVADLYYREPGNIHGKNQDRYTILVEHRCN